MCNLFILSNIVRESSSKLGLCLQSVDMVSSYDEKLSLHWKSSILCFWFFSRMTMLETRYQRSDYGYVMVVPESESWGLNLPCIELDPSDDKFLFDLNCMNTELFPCASLQLPLH